MNRLRLLITKIRNADFGDLRVFRRKAVSMISLAGAGGVCFCAAALCHGEPKFYNSIVMPAAHYLDPETAHRCAIWLASRRLLPRIQDSDPQSLRTSVWGLEFSNPIGLAAGFDKHAAAPSGLLGLGFGFVEVGSVTPQPQPGNDQPRVFRLLEDSAVINRYGFNSEGHDAVVSRMTNVRADAANCVKSALIGVNLGKNKWSEDASADFVRGINAFAETASYFVINISSPNTPGLRSLQQGEDLERLLDRTLEARDRVMTTRRIPILLKIAPDLSREQKEHIAQCALSRKDRLDGLVICNTTIQRPGHLSSPQRQEAGGLSGAPLHRLSTDTIAEMYKLTRGEIVIVGVGGISSGDEAYEKIRAGASLVQIYTALALHGPPIVKTIKERLAKLLSRDGFSSVAEAVGADHRTT